MFKNLMKAGKGTIAKKLMVAAGTVFGVALAATLLSKDDEDEFVDEEAPLDFEETEDEEDTSEESEEK